MINQLTSRAAQHHPVRRRADHTTPVGQASHARGTPCAVPVRPSIGLAPCSRHSWRRSLCPGLPVGRAGPQCTTAPNRNGPIIRIAVPLPCPFTLLIVVPGSQRICIHLHCRAYSPIRSRVTNHQFHTVLLLEWKEHACIGVLPPQCNAMQAWNPPSSYSYYLAAGRPSYVRTTDAVAYGAVFVILFVGYHTYYIPKRT